MKQMEKILKALANQRRLSIIKFLKKNQPASVGDIAAQIGLSFKATSKHLGILRAVGILERTQQRLTMFYGIADKQEPTAQSIIPLL